MYKIIGANQVEYGPVTAEQLRQWIAEGRVNAQTSAQAEGGTTWKPISEFPEFAGSFAPVSAPPTLGAAVPDGGRALALQEVSGAAIGLMVTAILGFVTAVGGIVVSMLGISFGALNGMNSGNPEAMRMIQAFNGFGIIARIIGIFVSFFILYGALKMKKLESHGLCVAASILAMIPCLSPCCLVGLPIGIWALVVLNKPEVKAQFT
jgi:hypothetical protein